MEKQLTAMQEFLSPSPSSSAMEEAQEFQNYVYESRRDFVLKVKQQDWDVDMRTAVDDILICFDQMANRLEKAKAALSAPVSEEGG